jgi:hypothetical protein
VVFGARFGKVVENEPFPFPSITFEDVMVGLGLVDHTTPLDVTGEPPSSDTFTVILAVHDVRDTIWLLTIGKEEPDQKGFPCSSSFST